MALTTVEQPKLPEFHVPPPDTFSPPPPVVVTPSDPIPRPYYFEDNLRKVRPYHFTYNTYCKERWRNRQVLEIFSAEFRDRPLEYYKNAIRTGNVVLNGKKCEEDTIVRNGDIISHTLHRHEPPVTAQDIGIVFEDDRLAVINKPAGVPVHPAGRYNYNSIIEIMRAEHAHYGWNPLPCNRLDRLTSGIMFIGKTKEAAEDVSKVLRERSIKKEYVARVVGEFPEGEVVCEQPILQISPKLGLNRVRANGKEARTVFRRLAYYPPMKKRRIDGHSEVNGTEAAGQATGEEPECSSNREANTAVAEGMAWKKLEGYSIVRCLPLTGRTHQLRVHLQFLGHPISNDPIYSNQRVFGSNLGAGDSDATNDEDIITRLSKMGKSEVADAVAYHDEMVDRYEKRKAERETGERCPVCDTPLYSDPGMHELGIYLHALKYKSDELGWDYETPLPQWALPPDGVEGPMAPTKESDPLEVDLQKLGLDEDGTRLENGKEKVGEAS